MCSQGIERRYLALQLDLVASGVLKYDGCFTSLSAREGARYDNVGLLCLHLEALGDFPYEVAVERNVEALDANEAGPVLISNDNIVREGG